jgi:hypothetical protein
LASLQVLQQPDERIPGGKTARQQALEQLTVKYCTNRGGGERSSVQVEAEMLVHIASAEKKSKLLEEQLKHVRHCKAWLGCCWTSILYGCSLCVAPAHDCAHVHAVVCWCQCNFLCKQSAYILAPMSLLCIWHAASADAASLVLFAQALAGKLRTGRRLMADNAALLNDLAELQHSNRDLARQLAAATDQLAHFTGVQFAANNSSGTPATGGGVDAYTADASDAADGAAASAGAGSSRPASAALVQGRPGSAGYMPAFLTAAGSRPASPGYVLTARALCDCCMQ